MCMKCGVGECQDPNDDADLCSKKQSTFMIYGKELIQD